jgi:Holliday junction resolvasome RuvABC DNA-binding subunit
MRILNIFHPPLLPCAPSPAKSRIRQHSAETKVFWFFSSEKNKESSFSEEKEAKRLLFLRLFEDTGIGRRGALLILAQRE